MIKMVNRICKNCSYKLKKDQTILYCPYIHWLAIDKHLPV
jgi:hypothetical protein